ncbi:MAG: inverse autotransporter beta domain-containing protein [Alphaproteobacteria bacterium]
MSNSYKIKILTVALSQVISPLAYAGEESNTKELNPHSHLGQKVIQVLNKNSEALGLKWVKGGMQSFSKYNFSGFSALSETSKQVIFAQGRFDYDGKSGKTLNLGLGARQLFQYPSGGDFILGVNAFYDLKSAQKGLFSSPHKRYSLGLELKDSVGDIYANIYRRQSGWINNERVLNGYDFGASTQIPSIPNSKLTINRYDFYSNVPKLVNKSNRQSGTKLRAEYFVTPHMSFGGELDRSDQNNSSKEVFINFTYNFGEKLNRRVNTTPSATKVWDKRYDEVIRENKVYLEKRLVVDIELGNRSVDLGDSIDVALTEEKDKGYKGDMQVTYSISETVKGLTGYNKDNIENETTINLSGVTFTEATESVNIPVTATIAASDKYAETVINYNVVVVANDSKKTSENGIKSLFLKFLELSENGFKSIFLKFQELVNSMWN